MVSETLNGTFAYLHHVCLQTHTTVHPTASKPVEPETTKVDPVETSSKSGYLQALSGLNLHHSQFAEQQQKDPCADICPDTEQEQPLQNATPSLENNTSKNFLTQIGLGLCYTTRML